MGVLTLPIDAHLPAIVAAVREHGGVIVSAEPGAGKTTRVPAALLQALDNGLLTPGGGTIMVLEPRRIAARTVAERVAAELGEEVGETIGYVTRFERAVSKGSRIVFVTEGVFARRLLADPMLEGVRAVILDEFHERHVTTDVGLAVLARLRHERASRNDPLGVVVMSATLDTEPLVRFLGVPVVVSQGRSFEISVEHAPRTDVRPIESQVGSALFELLERRIEGDVLVFLAGAREIRACMQVCRKLAERHELELLPLHGSLSAAEQRRALAPAARRKVVFATNVAETSVTIPGVGAVIDSGLANVASCSPWTGMPTLKLSKVSRASATQRAGRAGRTRAGIAMRLFTQADFAARPAFDTAEIARVDLCEPVLELAAQGIVDARSFAWYEQPPDQALASALTLLQDLGALDPTQGITSTGRRLLAFPVHPRLGRVLAEAEARGVSREACGLVATASERLRAPSAHAFAGRSDLFALVEDARREDNPTFRKVEAQLCRIARDRADPPRDAKALEQALLLATLTGFVDRLGRVKRTDQRGARVSREVVFARGGSAVLSETSGVSGDLVVAIDVEDRLEGTHQRSVVRVASEVEADWLLDLYTDRISDRETLSVSDKGRVELTRSMRFGELVLDETRVKLDDQSDPRVAEALAKVMRQRGLPVDARAALERIAVRIGLVRERSPSFGAPSTDPADEAAVLLKACEGKLTIEQVLETDFAALVESELTREQRALLQKLAPERVELPSGRSLAVKYATGVKPSVSSRLQDFFGMVQGPSILAGSQPLVLELLAPNQRAVQVTTDLARFWQLHYPEIARELRRKYPRHAWPDDPRNAAPPPPKRPTSRTG